MQYLCRRFSTIVAAGVLGAAVTSQASVLYVGMTNGASTAWTASAAVSSWTRATAADIPASALYATPALADLDGDGDTDAVVGQEHGGVVAWRNTGTSSAPAWVREAAWDVPSTCGARSAPALVDLDGDGDRDALVGCQDGTVAALRNAGSRTAPAWQPASGWCLGDLGDESRPAAGDVDGDGAADVLVGTKSGAVLGFRGTGDSLAPLARHAAFDAPTVGQRVTPGLGDLDCDGRPDLLLADGNAKFFAYRNVSGTWVNQAAWAPADPGSGPLGLALVATGGTATTTTTVPGATTTTVSPATTTTTTLPAGGNATPVARLAASPTSGAAPLVAHLDASASSDADGQALAFAWDFGDGMVVGTPDPTTVLSAAGDDFEAARAARDAGHYEQSIEMNLALAARLLPLTGIKTTAPVTVQGTNRVDRVARWYLQKLAHVIGGIYLNHSLGLATCERYTMSLQFSRESAAQAVAGSFPELPSLNGTDNNIASATDKLRDAGCPVPPYEPMLTTEPVAAGPVVDHVYDQPGTYTATVTVSDGAASASRSATIVVGTLPPPPPPPPPPAGEPLQGFGATTPGGEGGRTIHVTTATEKAVRDAIASANQGGHAVIVFDVPGPITITSPLKLGGAFVTIEGNGATLRGDKLGSSMPMLEVNGHDVIVRNLRLRNGGDNLRAQGDGAYNIVFSHISSTGAKDDGISVGYGAHDVTIQYCFLAGNTRSIFMKYGKTTRVSVHHTWIMKQWVRGPLVSQSVMADLRNLVIDDWTMWGTRFEKQGCGNAVNSLWRLSPYAASVGGKKNSALRVTSSLPVFTAGNVYQGSDQGQQGTAVAPYDAAPVTTQSVAEMTAVVEARAGVMPRDAVDQAYLDCLNGWKVTESKPLRIPF